MYLTALILIVILTILFLLGPSRKLKLRHALPGAVIATVGWMVTSWGFSFYVSNFGNYSATYGSLGGVIVLVMWVFLTGLILMIGAEINVIHHRRKNKTA